MKEKRLIGEYTCMSDSGEQYTVLAYQEFSDNIKTLKYLVTSNGLKVGYINSETFKIIATDEIVRKI